jgi:hypothetical protein
MATIASTAIGGLKLGAKVFGFGRGSKKGPRREKPRDDERSERPRLRKRG